IVEPRQSCGRAIGASLGDLALGDDPASAYLADLLTRFARTDHLYPQGFAMPRLETVVDMLLETQAAWENPASFQPEREVVVRRHIGDFTLFMTGIFPERVERTASTRYYIDQGKRAYAFVSEHDRVSSRTGGTGAPLYRRLAERATRAWASGVDGSGSRALWILFEGGFGGAALCSLIVNDTAGMLEVAGGEITKRRLEAELAALRSSQKLPWVECDPARAVGLVAEALALHAAEGTAPPDAFARSAALAELPEMAGWFLDPEAVQVDAVELLAARESRLVVSDQVKAEREDAIVGRVIARELGPEARRR